MLARETVFCVLCMYVLSLFLTNFTQKSTKNMEFYITNAIFNM